MRIKKDDTVIVLAGKDKGKTGKVLKAMPKTGKVIVEGVNIQTKHAKQTQKTPAESRGNDGRKGKVGSLGWTWFFIIKMVNYTQQVEVVVITMLLQHI